MIIRPVGFALFALMLNCFISALGAPEPYFFDTVFNPPADLATSVSTVTISSDEKIFVGGNFASDSGSYRAILRMDQAGNVDPSFRSGTDLVSVSSIAPLSDGSVAVTALFDPSQRAVVKLAPDGKLLWRTLLNNFASTASELPLMARPNGTLIVGGHFTNVGGFTRRSLALLASDGTVQPAFDLAFNGPIRTLSQTPDGLIYAGGAFTTVNDLHRSRLVRLKPDGSLDLTFDPGEALSVEVSCLALQRDGRILVGGVFNNNPGYVVKRLLRLLPDGSVDPDFQILSGPDDFVKGLVVDSQDRIILAGSFSHIDGLARPYLARLLPNGTPDPSFNPPGGPNSPLRDLVLDSHGRYIVAGSFDQIGNRHQFSLARFFPQELGPTVDFDSDRFTTTEDNREFSIPLRRFGSAENPIVVEISTTPTNNLSEFPLLHREIRFEPNEFFKTISIPLPDDGRVEGDEILPLRCRVLSGGPTVERSAELLVHDDELPVFFEDTVDSPLYQFSSLGLAEANGLLAIGGAVKPLKRGFASFNGLALSHMDGQPELTLEARAERYSKYGPAQVQALAWTPENKLLVGGWFDSLGSYSQSNLVRLHPDGTLDPAFKPYSPGAVTALLVRPDNKVIVAGEFIHVGSTSLLAQFTASGEWDPSFQPAPDIQPSHMALQPDGRLLVSCVRSGLVRLLIDGAPDASFEKLPDEVDDILSAPNGTIYIAGNFTLVRGVRRHHLARLQKDGSLDLSFNPEPPLQGILSLLLQPDGKLLVTAAGQVVRLNPDGSLDNTLQLTGLWNYGMHPILLSDGRVLIFGAQHSTTHPEQRRTYSFLAPTNSTLTKIVFENSQLSVDESNRLDLNFRRIGDTSQFLPARIEVTNGNEPVLQDLRMPLLISLSPRLETSRLTLEAMKDSLIEPDEIFRFRTLPVPAVSALASEPAFLTVRDMNGRPGAISYLESIAPRFSPANITAGNSRVLMFGNLRDPITLLTHDGALITNVTFPQELQPWQSLVAVAQDDSFYVAGNLITTNQLSLGALYRILPDGRIDPAFKTVPFYLAPQSIAIEPSGNILVAGRWIHPGRDTLYRFHSDGTLERSWPLLEDIQQIASLPDGNIIYTPGGHVTFFSPDINAQTNFNAIAPGGGSISSLAVNGDYFYVTGDFTNVNGFHRTGIVRAFSTGLIDQNFAPEIFPPIVHTVAFDDQNRLLISGGFDTVNGIARPALARIFSDGSLDLSFDPGKGIFGPNGQQPSIDSLAITPNGIALAVVSHLNSPIGTRLARLNADLPFSLNLHHEPRGLQLSLNSNPGQTFAIQTSSDLTNWSTLLETNAAGYQIWFAAPPPPVFIRAQNASLLNPMRDSSAATPNPD
jgi:uncharacterized delta-60 repeat protein